MRKQQKAIIESNKADKIRQLEERIAQLEQLLEESKTMTRAANECANMLAEGIMRASGGAR